MLTCIFACCGLSAYFLFRSAGEQHFPPPPIPRTIARVSREGVLGCRGVSLAAVLGMINTFGNVHVYMWVLGAVSFGGRSGDSRLFVKFRKLLQTEGSSCTYILIPSLCICVEFTAVSLAMLGLFFIYPSCAAFILHHLLHAPPSWPSSSPLPPPSPPPLASLRA